MFRKWSEVGMVDRASIVARARTYDATRLPLHGLEPGAQPHRATPRLSLISTPRQIKTSTNFTTMQPRFEAKKRKILEVLETPDEEYHDLSPKGSVDEPIRPLIAEINRLPGLVTTSSCSGRLSVFCEGKKKASGSAEDALMNVGGKGQGKWLYISHDPVQNAQDTDFMSLFGLKEPDVQKQGDLGAESSYIHLKFEPMVRNIKPPILSSPRRCTHPNLPINLLRDALHALG